MDLSSQCNGGSDRQVPGILFTVPSEDGNGVIGFHEGDGLHRWPSTRDGEEGCPCSFAGATSSKAEEERKVPERKAGGLCRGGGLDVGPRDDGHLVDPTDPVPLSKWVNLLLRSVLATKTPFAAFVSKSIHCNLDRSSMPVHSALFPIPLPLDDAWIGVPSRLGVQGRRRLALRRLVRLVILALNYLHARAPFSVVPLLWRRPCSLHLRVYDRVAALCRAGGPPEMISIFGCGRKSFQLDARFRELLGAVQSLGIGGSMYHSGGEGKPVSIVNDKDQLVPYRQLDASRLKIVGSGNWDCRPFLDELFYMPFVEPAINTYDIECPGRFAPDLSRCDPDETLALCRVWDAKNLLRLFHVDEAPVSKKKYVKVFNNYKGPGTDRQIGDRRGANYSEGMLAGVSQRLPTGCSLLQIMPAPFQEVLKGSITDRRDFYHQIGVSRERCLTNVVYPPMPLDAFVGLRAHGEFLEEAAGKLRQGREVIGDFLHQKPKPLLVDESTYVVAGFSALFQGDHLGVEVATLAHSNLLVGAGLLEDKHRLQGGVPLMDDSWAEGLVIDDYFVISKEVLGADEPSVSALKLEAAKACYLEEKILGSDDKDVISSEVFKVCGVEIDSREEMVRRGAISAGAPAEKAVCPGFADSKMC